MSLVRHPAPVVQTEMAGTAGAAAAGEDALAISLVLAGDTSKFRTVVERHQLRLHRIIYRLVGHPEDAAELTQQAFLAAFTALGRFDPVYPFSPWLVRIGVNLAKDHLKSSRRRELPDAPDEIDGREHSTFANPERSFAGSESRRQLARALATLSLADREILVLKDVEELSYEEIRAILHRPITALKIRALRARRRLRVALEKIAPEAGPSA